MDTSGLSAMLGGPPAPCAPLARFPHSAAAPDAASMPDFTCGDIGVSGNRELKVPWRIESADGESQFVGFKRFPPPT